jgi:hypothetical protein
MKNAENHQPSSHPTINLSALLCALCASAFILLICGCGPDARDARIAKLEKQVTTLEGKCENIRTNLIESMEVERDMCAVEKTNFQRIDIDRIDYQLKFAEISLQFYDLSNQVAEIAQFTRAGTKKPH